MIVIEQDPCSNYSKDFDIGDKKLSSVIIYPYSYTN